VGQFGRILPIQVLNCQFFYFIIFFSICYDYLKEENEGQISGSGAAGLEFIGSINHNNQEVAISS
jgi:hypothetical protein